MSCLRYIYMCPIFSFIIIHHLMLTGFFYTDCSFFYKLKINHDSYEFILEFGTVANTKVYVFWYSPKSDLFQDIFPPF
jgi:hypothetical protein